MTNPQVAHIFRDIATILQIKGDNPFRIRAYERAAQIIEGLSHDLEEFAKAGELTSIPGIGKDLADKINEFISTGKIQSYEQLKRSVASGMLELLKIPSIGPKTALLLYENLHCNTLEEFEKLLSQGRLKGIPGIKDKTIENIKKGIAFYRKGTERMSLAQAVQLSNSFLNALKDLPQTVKISSAGSLRRMKETVRDIDMLIVSRDPGKVMDTVTKLPFVKEVIAQGQTKSSMRTIEGVQVDCRVVPERSFGAALLYFTGSKAFNIRLRTMAVKAGMKINEYGLFSVASGKKGASEKFIAGQTEEDIFRILGLQFIPPEMREDTGEIELAKEGRLPVLLTVDDIKGDLHVHSKWSDGRNSIPQLAEACRSKGYSYVAICDHSQSLKIAGGLDKSGLKKKKKEIDKLNSSFQDFRILYGAEVDIMSDGTMDYSDAVLKEFDIVIGSIHTGFKQSKERITGRIIRAMNNKHVHIIAHPTARLFGQREGYELDLERLFKEAARTNTALELNSYPDRLDLNDANCRRAKEMGCRIAINSDAHAVQELESVLLGIGVARRGWLCAEDVLNTLPVEKLLEHIRK